MCIRAAASCGTSWLATRITATQVRVGKSTRHTVSPPSAPPTAGDRRRTLAGGPGSCMLRTLPASLGARTQKGEELG